MKSALTQEMMEKVITRAWTDDAFKAAVLENPKGVLEREFGYTVPESVRIEAVEETALTRYLVIPRAGEGPDDSGFPGSDQEMSRRDMLKTACAAAGKTLVLAAGISAWFSLSDLITRRAFADEQFRKELRIGPKKALKRAFDIDVPDVVEVKTLEETSDKQYLVLPHQPDKTGELSDDDLEVVAAGGRSSGGEDCGDVSIDTSSYHDKVTKTPDFPKWEPKRC
ncbi:NHLP leader peptide family RiPP precursor [Desulfonema magnum]|uniref:Nitrile hydratase family protein n=1 Tax=Desulfonema magnum TaxID=45655 RepID=A0A975BH49_9BACT|nr:NHLP leader peptide family RiPP precursor [Desulfonema magnum]QTA85218.1 Nitrile hydratase family protein [Desulfonema magnum]